ELSPGGLSGTVMDENGFFWDMGGHVTFDHHFPYYKEAMCWAIDEWNVLTRNCQIDISYMFNEEGLHLVPYPVQYSVPMFPATIRKKCLRDLRERCGKSKINVWTVKPDEMNSIWVGTRVAKMAHEKLEELCAKDAKDLQEVDFGWGPNAKFMFPKRYGTGSIWKSMSDKLPSKWFRFGCELRPIDQLIKRTKLCEELDLKYNKVFVVGIGLMKPMSCVAEQFTWLYFPENTVPFYRVTFLSRYGEMTPDSNKYWSVLCECAYAIDDDNVTKEGIVKQTIQCLTRKKIISREQIVSVFSVLLSYGYPIPTVNRDKELTRAHRILENHEIYSRGRFGGWKYEVANQDHCFMQGKEIIDRILLGKPETVYRNGLSA
ncbi:unnamed protein product, partial [Litomosoides sigmodontis]